jgi:uncharacterized protein
MVALALTVGCATHQMKMGVARANIVNGNYDSAVKSLEPLATKEDDDQLVYLLEYGTALQLAGDYKKSNNIFQRADKISAINDYHSISRVTGSLLFNEGMVQYKGEHYEKVLINAFSAINYLMLGELDEANVEARRLNEKLQKYKNDAQLPYTQSPWARYLSAMIWESNGKWDDAYIDYEETYKLNPNIPLLREDLIRLAKKAKREDALKKWQKEFPEVTWRKEWDEKNFGEIVLIYQQGWGPVKRPNPQNFSFPMLFSSFSETKRANLIVDNYPPAPTSEIYNISEVTIKTFNDQMGELVAKRIGAHVVKAVAADQIRQKNQGLGDLAYLVMRVSDQADTRHWSSLPESFQIARLRVPAGDYNVTAQGFNYSNQPSGEFLPQTRVTVKPRKFTFVNWRSVR